jgi:hypothetical protein
MLVGLRTYPVQPRSREPLISFIQAGLADVGCRTLYASPPNQAPFVLSFETPAGERLGVVAYAFLANRTVTKNRPPDERSFQIKYGSKETYADGNLHPLWQDPAGLYTTLLMGIDPKDGFFVAADPEQHNPTKFFIRVEFKDEHAEAALEEGWHVWTRGRGGKELGSSGETMIAGRRNRLLDLIRLEREAFGAPPRDRLDLALELGHDQV